MKKITLFIMFLLLVLAPLFANESAGPHGGVLIELGEGEFAHLELVLDSKKGSLTAYVLDGEAQNLIRIPQEEIKIKTKSQGDIILKVVTDAGETTGDASRFSGQSERMIGVFDFQGSVVSIFVNGKEIDGVFFHYSKKD